MSFQSFGNFFSKPTKSTHFVVCSQLANVQSLQLTENMYLITRYLYFINNLSWRQTEFSIQGGVEVERENVGDRDTA